MLTVNFDQFQLAPGMSVLDAGCGQGRHSLAAQHYGCRVLAMDRNLEDLRYTRYLLTATASAAYSKTPSDNVAPWFVVIQGDVLHLPLSTACLDRIICSEVLEHVADPGQATAELARVLKPGGLLAVSVPTPFTEWAYRFGSDDYFNSPGGHLRIFTPPRLQRLLAEHGLYVFDLSLAHALHSLYWWVRCVVGLHDDSHCLIRHSKKMLTHLLFSPPLACTERLLNYVIPKSLVVYAQKRCAPRGDKAI